MIASAKSLAELFGHQGVSHGLGSKSEPATCRCGKKVSRKDLEFWGECLDCRINSNYSPPPARSAYCRSNRILLAERQYHGERTQNGE